MSAPRIYTVGLISDTHGLLRPEAVVALQGCDCIIHAGDIGAAEILNELRTIAPLTAIRGNNDTDPWAAQLPDTAECSVGGIRLFVLHNNGELAFDPAVAGFAVVVAGHSHRPAWRQEGEVLFINPGSAGPRRFNLPVAVARLRIESGRVTPQLIELPIAAAPARKKIKR
jgi:uncharacterized protein